MGGGGGGGAGSRPNSAQVERVTGGGNDALDQFP